VFAEPVGALVVAHRGGESHDHDCHQGDDHGAREQDAHHQAA
jgi:hypothetical protein